MREHLIRANLPPQQSTRPKQKSQRNDEMPELHNLSLHTRRKRYKTNYRFNQKHRLFVKMFKRELSDE